MPSIAIGELLAGFRLGAHEQRNTAELWDFLADPAADVLDVDVHVAERYSLIYADLRRGGTPIPTNDMWIAATASANGMTILTVDDNFSAIPDVPSLVLETVDQVRTAPAKLRRLPLLLVLIGVGACGMRTSGVAERGEFVERDGRRRRLRSDPVF